LAGKFRAAFMAGQGASAAEIADALGGTTAHRVRAILRGMNVPLMRKTSVEDVLLVRWRVGDRRALEEKADLVGREPGALAALILRKVLAREGMVEELVNRHDVVGID
jgi:hypothetical protein